VVLALVGVGVPFGCQQSSRIATNQGDRRRSWRRDRGQGRARRRVVQDKTAGVNSRDAGKGEIEVFAEGRNQNWRRSNLSGAQRQIDGVTLEELADARKPKPKERAATTPRTGIPTAGRRVRCCRSGGLVRVNADGRISRPPTDLPKGPFQLTFVEADRQSAGGDDGLALLQRVRSWRGSACKDAGERRRAAHFSGCKNLMWLPGQHTGQRRGAGLFKGCRNLTSSPCPARGERRGSGRLQGLQNLGALWLINMKISDAGLAHFKAAKTDGLDVSGSPGERRGSDPLRGLQKTCCVSPWAERRRARRAWPTSRTARLRELDVMPCRSVTPSGPFQGLQELTTLNLDARHNGHRGKVDELRKALPQCRIEFDGGVIEPAAKYGVREGRRPWPAQPVPRSALMGAGSEPIAHRPEDAIEPGQTGANRPAPAAGIPTEPWQRSGDLLPRAAAPAPLRPAAARCSQGRWWSGVCLVRGMAMMPGSIASGIGSFLVADIAPKYAPAWPVLPAARRPRPRRE